MDKLQKTVDEWKAMLDPEQYNVCRLKGTERPFSGKVQRHQDRRRLPLHLLQRAAVRFQGQV